jgi:hypothetical protein
MSITRNTIIAGLAALSLTVGASPAMARGGGDGGGDINNTVIQIAPDLVVTPISNSGSGSGGGGGGKCCKFSGGVLINGV